MKNISKLLMAIFIIGACSDEPTSKYANAEECAFKESKDCEDKSCSSLAYSYCQKSFAEINAQKQALEKTCREYKETSLSCPRRCDKPKEPKKDGFDFEYFRYESCMDGEKNTCSEEAISKRDKFIKNKCN